MELCPSIGVKISVELALKQLVDEGVIAKERVQEGLQFYVRSDSE